MTLIVKRSGISPVQWRVPYIDLPAQYRDLKPQIDAAMQRVMASGGFILRDEVRIFEERMADYLRIKHVIGVGSGYDALFLALKAMNVGPGDEVVTDSYTHVSTHAAIAACGASVVIGSQPTRSTKIWLPVHMNGSMQDISDAPCPVIEDACQALGASLWTTKAGTKGDIGCFSCHPMKILSAAGDGGFIATWNDSYAETIRALRNHGGGRGYGVNSRLDTLQAAILNVKMDRLGWYITRRRDIASQYEAGITNARVPKPPPPSEGERFDVYSSYVVGGSPELLAHLAARGIEAFSHVRTDCVSLPIFPEMSQEQIDYVIEAANAF